MLRSSSGPVRGSLSAISLSDGTSKFSRDNSNFVHTTLSEVLSSRLIELAHTNETTIGNAITAASMKAMNARKDIWVFMQADFRRIYPSKSDDGFLFGNLTPAISISRSHSALTSHTWQLAASIQKEIASSWNALRLTATYFVYYGAMCHWFLPMLDRYVIRSRKSAPFSVPVLTIRSVREAFLLFYFSRKQQLGRHRSPARFTFERVIKDALVESRRGQKNARSPRVCCSRYNTCGVPPLYCGWLFLSWAHYNFCKLQPICADSL